jgi:DNA-binding FadR family transcriptional regulator
MLALETGGKIEVRHGNGAYVREDSAHGTDIDWNRGGQADPGPFEQFEMREILEPEAASRAARRIPQDQIDALDAMLGRMKARVADTGSQRDGRTFMERIAAASGNSILQSMIEELWRLRDGRMWTTLRMRMLGPEQRAAAIVRREAIIAALRARDPDAARRATQDYLALTKRIYFGDLAGPADEDR